jgi:outer membrane lipopolysaccharide assembly protein LptE/RlpB
MRRLRFPPAALAAMALLLATGCGYRLAGTGSLLPSHVKTIHIPYFENETHRPGQDGY